MVGTQSGHVSNSPELLTKGPLWDDTEPLCNLASFTPLQGGWVHVRRATDLSCEICRLKLWPDFNLRIR
jgi:hypothetical protein